MRLRLPICHAEISVPTWCVAVAVLWPVVFVSFLLHLFAIGGDAVNGKVEAGRYYLWKTIRSDAEATRYLEVSKPRYAANYIHAVATMILVVPTFIAMWRIVGQIRGTSDGLAQAKR